MGPVEIAHSGKAPDETVRCASGVPNRAGAWAESYVNVC
jgi:hypothetical protein